MHSENSNHTKYSFKLNEKFVILIYANRTNNSECSKTGLK